jgi:hypothetical protein
MFLTFWSMKLLFRAYFHQKNFQKKVGRKFIRVRIRIRTFSKVGSGSGSGQKSFGSATLLIWIYNLWKEPICPIRFGQFHVLTWNVSGFLTIAWKTSEFYEIVPATGGNLIRYVTLLHETVHPFSSVTEPHYIDTAAAPGKYFVMQLQLLPYYIVDMPIFFLLKWFFKIFTCWIKRQSRNCRSRDASLSGPFKMKRLCFYYKLF